MVEPAAEPDGIHRRELPRQGTVVRFGAYDRHVAETQLLGYNAAVPTVLRVAGFRVVIFLPPREHPPPHVHVRNAHGEAAIELASSGRPQVIRAVAGMRSADAIRAFRIVEEHTEFLLAKWREYHG